MPAATVQPEAGVRCAQQLRCFFVRGYMRSGTTWLRALLNLHPRVVCGGEFNLPVVHSAVERITRELPWCEGAQDERVRQAMDEALQEFVRRVLEALAQRKPGACVVGDCTPNALAPLLLPEAPRVLLVRDGRDVLVSWSYWQLARDSVDQTTRDNWPSLERLRSLLRSAPETFEAEPWRLVQDEPWVRFVARDWARRVMADLDLLDQLQEPRDDAQQGGALLVRYEDLLSDVDAELARIWRLLGVDPEEAAPVSETTRTVPGYSADDPRSFHRKGVVGDWKRHATDDFRRWFKEEAGQALVRLGYEQDHDW